MDASADDDAYQLAVARGVGASHGPTDPYILYLVSHHAAVTRRLSAAPPTLFRDYVLALVQEAVATHRARATAAMRAVNTAASDAREASSQCQ